MSNISSSHTSAISTSEHLQVLVHAKPTFLHLNILMQPLAHPHGIIFKYTSGIGERVVNCGISWLLMRDHPDSVTSGSICMDSTD